MLPVLHIARALAQRILPERRPGLSAYFRDQVAERVAMAHRQLAYHTKTTRLLDVGCGRDLHASLVAAVCHRKRVIGYDVAPHLDLQVVDFTLRHLGHPGGVANLDDLRALGIDYVVAPTIPEYLAFDGVMSTAVIEHLPPPVIDRHLTLFNRHLPAGSVISAVIDYRDHWSYISQLPPTAFYGHDTLTWWLLNSSRMYQNRLRHGQVRSRFDGAGFALVDEQLTTMPVHLERSRLAPCFRACSDADLGIGGALVAWRKP
jgi:SAM-dependent methyltransferase